MTSPIRDIHTMSGLTVRQMARLFSVRKREVTDWVRNDAAPADKAAHVATVCYLILLVPGPVEEKRERLLTRLAGRSFYRHLVACAKNPTALCGLSEITHRAAAGDEAAEATLPEVLRPWPTAGACSTGCSTKWRSLRNCKPPASPPGTGSACERGHCRRQRAGAFPRRRRTPDQQTPGTAG